MNKQIKIQPATGKLGILTPGMGAVATTFIAGVIAARKGLALPIGSLTQMGTIRLGKRTEDRNPRIRDFAPLAGLDQIVFGGWDVYSDNVYQAALEAKVLDRTLVEQLKDELQTISPMKAVFDKTYVRNLDGKHVKTGATKMDLAEQLMEDIRRFKADNGCDRLVMVWCASTEGVY
jgi:myo-inositol-1-phosphate synthase